MLLSFIWFIEPIWSPDKTNFPHHLPPYRPERLPSALSPRLIAGQPLKTQNSSLRTCLKGGVISHGERGILRPMPTPEDHAREHIDEALEQAGWRVQDYKSANLHVGRGVILRKCRPDIGRKEIQRLSTDNQGSMRNIGQDIIRQIAFALPDL